MSETLVQSGVVPEDRRAEAEAALKLAWRGEIALSWSVDDVQGECPGLTEEEVLEKVLRKHDASVGVNWDVIRIHACDLYGERALEEQEDDEDEDDVA